MGSTKHLKLFPKRLVNTLTPHESYYYTKKTEADRVEWKANHVVLRVEWRGSRTHGGWVAFIERIDAQKTACGKRRLTPGLMSFNQACAVIDMCMQSGVEPPSVETDVPLRDWIDEHVREHTFKVITPDDIEMAYSKSVYAHQQPFIVETEQSNK